MSDRPTMNSPPNIDLPFFVYGALKPGMPGYEGIREFVGPEPKIVCASGELFVRDGLPLLFLNNYGPVKGFLIYWKDGSNDKAYRAICDFEPRKHYEWKEIVVDSSIWANVLGLVIKTREILSRMTPQSGD